MDTPRDKPADATAAAPRRRRRWWIRLVAYPAVFVLLCLVLNMTGLADRLFFVPDRNDYGKPEKDILPYEPVTFESRDGTRLSGWFFPSLGRKKGTVIHLHGNAANISNHFRAIAFLPPLEYSVLAFDYRGYGDSQGAPSRAGCLEDVFAAIDYAKGRKDVDPARIALFGQSLGASYAIVAAAERPEVKAVVAEAPFTSHRGIARTILRRSPVTWIFAGFLPELLLGGSYAPIDYVDRIAPRPLLLAHGTADALIPYTMSEALLERAKEPKRLHTIPGGEHLCIPDGATEDAYRKAVVDFLDASLGPPPGERLLLPAAPPVPSPASPRPPANR
jgi:fermentation-respiration switch protein FrsA (DUF1100 family)